MASRRRFMSGLRATTALAAETKSLNFSSYGGGATPALNGRMRGGAIYGNDRAATWDMDTVIAEGYEQSVWVYRCVELYAQSQSRLPFRVGRNLGEDDFEILDNHPLYRVMNKRANPLETGRQFRKRLSAQVLLSKRGAFIEVTKSRAGTITRLDLLDPQRTIPIPSDSGDYLKHFEYTRRDGVVREIDPERVRWVREPHPTDPFSGTTPLEAAGMSVELDQLSRLYNVSFIRNDSRPGGVLAVDTDTLRDAEMERLERRFKSGAFNAGELAVVASGKGGLNYVDTTTRPRDMSYGEASQNAKNEVLTAFGVGESLLGNASGRTFDNAEQEEYNFWTKPMPPHLDLISGAFSDDVDEDWEPFLDTSKVEALEVAVRRRRKEAMDEFNAGLRSIDEYRPLTKLDPIANPQSRALWISPAKAPVPANADDAAALLGPEGGSPAAEQAPSTTGQADQPASDLVERARDIETDDTPPAGPAAAILGEARLLSQVVPGDGDAAAILSEARDTNRQARTARVVTAVSSALTAEEGKALTPQPAPIEYAPSDQLTAQAEAALVAALQATLARQRGVIAARLAAPKARKGTRFWRPDGEQDTRTGDAPVDVARVIDTERWTDEVTATSAPLVQSTAVEAAAALLGVLAAAGALDVAAASMEQAAGAATRGVSLRAITTLADALVGFLGGLDVRLVAAQATAASIGDVIAAAENYYDEHADTWARAVGGDVAHATVVAATDAAASSLLSEEGRAPMIVREWITRRDARVRPTHRDVDGTTLPVGQPFTVGTETMLYPQDPTASAHERYGCRCRLIYRATPGASFRAAA